MSGHTAGTDYANEAYKACLYGRADARQQRSAAAQISILHSIKAELLGELREGAQDMSNDARLEWKSRARALVAKATSPTMNTQAILRDQGRG